MRALIAIEAIPAGGFGDAVNPPRKFYNLDALRSILTYVFRAQMRVLGGLLLVIQHKTKIHVVYHRYDIIDMHTTDTVKHFQHRFNKNLVWLLSCVSTGVD